LFLLLDRGRDARQGRKGVRYAVLRSRTGDLFDGYSVRTGGRRLLESGAFFGGVTGTDDIGLGIGPGFDIRSA
jgi:hypothetical protein